MLVSREGLSLRVRDFFGLDPAGHHVVNVLWHAFNTGLLSLTLSRLTGRCRESVLVGVLFGLHPLHVESVAWMAERKDLLSSCFGSSRSWPMCNMRGGEGDAMRPRRWSSSAAA